jgi:tryptophan-rich sensory protein
MNESGGLGLFAFVALNMVAASSGGLFRPGEWYEHLAKPRWRPPNWLFAPAWTLLYSINAYAGWVIWDSGDWEMIRPAMSVYVISLVLNACWSGIFFGLRNPGLALVELVFLWLSILAKIILFLPLDQTAALLLVPYLCWVTFAGILNHAIWKLNPGAAHISA